jgi:hypothetical protein
MIRRTNVPTGQIIAQLFKIPSAMECQGLCPGVATNVHLKHCEEVLLDLVEKLSKKGIDGTSSVKPPNATFESKMGTDML